MKLFAIKDVKIGFMSPFKHHSEATAIRETTLMVNYPEKTPVTEHIQDKELWILGEYNENTGVITSEVRYLCKLNELIKGGTTNDNTSNITGNNSNNTNETTSEVRDDTQSAQSPRTDL